MPPSIKDNPPLQRVLRLIRILNKRSAGEVPMLGVVISPFSLPIMQLGFGPYLDLLHDQPLMAKRLLQVNKDFCVAWANAQFQAGATALVYFDPMSSPTITDPGMARSIGMTMAQRVLRCLLQSTE